jgi:2-(1,2-epoxy-1,2-dihydrophenyl)acetyl-CoA isomerase
MYETILYEVEGGVAKLTMNRPERFNAFITNMFREMMDALRKAERSSDVRCIVLGGAGKAFNAGQDLTEVPATPNDYGEHLHRNYNPLIMQMRSTPKPIIAAIGGAAAGAGLSLALACDFRLASDRASFSNAFIHIGLVPDAGNSYFLPRIVGLGKAMELACMGEKLSAEQALEIGLINRLYAADEFEAGVADYASKLAAMPTRTIGLIKRTMNQSLSSDLETALGYEAYSQTIAGGTSDHREGIQAFMEKRKPNFSGK